MTLGCAGSTDSAGDVPAGATCEEVVEQMAACYPDLANEAACTDDTLAEFERMGAEVDCDAVERDGKADFFSFGGCPAGQHRCGWIFCCDDYRLTWHPSRDADWDIVDVVEGFQQAAPTDAVRAVQQADPSALRRVVAASFLQDVAEYPNAAPVEMAVEYTRGLVDLSFDDLQQVLPAEDWGIRLGTWIGGEVKVYARDGEGRATRQLERMVLSPCRVIVETPLSNNDMTKVEVIHYRPGGATVYWRVMHSDNDSTETDVGSVDFSAYGHDATLVTFHSAHRLNAPGGIHLPNDLVKLALGETFAELVRGYQDYVAPASAW